MDIEVNDSTINSFMIEGLSKNIPLIDIFILLSKQVNDIKKITFYHDPINYISKNCKCQVDFANHDSLLKAKLILNAENLNKLLNSKEPKIRISECQLNRSNLINEAVSETTALMFENMQINNINILEFIFHLKKFINSNNENNKSKYKITKVRQYSNRILVIFEPNVPENIKQFLQRGENELHPPIPYFNYKGKNIPIIPKMKPAVNIGKYKEKYIKLSVHNLNEDDRENLFSIFERNQDNNSDENLIMSKMAENAFNNILNKEKLMREEKIKKNNNINNTSLNKKRERERERNREKINEKEKDRRDRDRDRDLMNRDKIRDNRNRDMKINRRDRDIRDRRDKNRDYNNRNIMDERREDSSSDRDRKMDNMNMNNSFRNKGNYNNNFIEGNNMINNNNNNINNNLSGLNINEKDLNQVASLFSNANAVNIVKYLLENNAFNNINPKTNNNNQNLNSNINNNIGNMNNMNNNNNLIQNKIPMKINEEQNSNNNMNLLKNNFNEGFNNMYNQNQNQNNMSNNVNYQQLINVLQSQTQNNIMNNNKNNQSQQRVNNNMTNNFQNVINMNQMMRLDNNNNNNLMNNNNYFNNQRQFQFPLNDQFMNQFSSFNSQQKRKNNENN